MKSTTVVLAAVLLPALASAQVKEKKRLDACREVLEELLGGEERIPRDLLDKAECVAVVPNALKFALGFGGRWGKGAVVCRTHDGAGPWGPPLLISAGGGSFGLQIGGQAADYVFLVLDPKRLLVEGGYPIPPEARGLVGLLESSSPRRVAGQ
jgi:lipid-binding SYLF domain-containing protein